MPNETPPHTVGSSEDMRIHRDHNAQETAEAPPSTPKTSMGEALDRPGLFSPESRSAMTGRGSKPDEGRTAGGPGVSTSKYGSVCRVSNDEWCVDVYCVPASTTSEERLFSKQALF